MLRQITDSKIRQLLHNTITGDKSIFDTILIGIIHKITCCNAIYVDPRISKLVARGS